MESHDADWNRSVLAVEALKSAQHRHGQAIQAMHRYLDASSPVLYSALPGHSVPGNRRPPSPPPDPLSHSVKATGAVGASDGFASPVHWIAHREVHHSLNARIPDSRQTSRIQSHLSVTSNDRPRFAGVCLTCDSNLHTAPDFPATVDSVDPGLDQGDRCSRTPSGRGRLQNSRFMYDKLPSDLNRSWIDDASHRRSGSEVALEPSALPLPSRIGQTLNSNVSDVPLMATTTLREPSSGVRLEDVQVPPGSLKDVWDQQVEILASTVRLLSNLCADMVPGNELVAETLRIQRSVIRSIRHCKASSSSAIDE